MEPTGPYIRKIIAELDADALNQHYKSSVASARKQMDSGMPVKRLTWWRKALKWAGWL